MSGLAAFVQLDMGKPPRRLFEELVRRLDHRGPDGSDIRWLRGAALAHAHFWTTPEEVGERQPVADDRGELHLCFDGRLDNREELGLLLQPEGGPSLSDAALILASYRRWGRECLTRLLGPFALALYDSSRRALLCGRDALGDRSLFYTSTSTAFLVASEEAALLTMPGVSRELDEETLARFFAYREPSPGRTFYSAIHELPPAHGLWLEEGRVELFEHWLPEGRQRLSYRDDRDYEEHFRELLERSVRRRLRVSDRPAVLMSGGLDSTSLAALAARQLQAEGGRRLTAITWIFDQLPSCDERLFARSVARRCALEAIELPADHLGPVAVEQQLPVGDGSPTANPYRRLLDAAYSEARRAGCRTLLTGWSGDHLWLGSERWLADLLREHRWAEAVGEILAELMQGGSLRRAAGPVAELLRLRRRAAARIDAKAFPWLTPLALDHLRATEETSGDRRRHLFAGIQVWNLVAERKHASRSGIEVRNPYRDRELVEAMVAMPAH